MAEVYWIRLPEHTDMFSEGYIGMTIKTSAARYQGHVYASRRSGNSSVIGSVIRKYGYKSLIVDTLVICSSEYTTWLENKLRPEKGIGWNMAVGGEYLGGSRIVSAAARENMSKAQTGRILSEETRKKISRKLSTRIIPENERESRDLKKFYSYMKAYSSVYSKADLAYKLFVTGTSCYKTEKLLGLNKSSLQKLFKRFSGGWIPYEDNFWCEEYLNKEAVNGS